MSDDQENSPESNIISFPDQDNTGMCVTLDLSRTSDTFPIRCGRCKEDFAVLGWAMQSPNVEEREEVLGFESWKLVAFCVSCINKLDKEDSTPKNIVPLPLSLSPK